MANEGAELLDEGIAMRASDVDLVFINGYGFPRAKGGPMWTADAMGLTSILAELEAAKRENPGSIEIAALIRRFVDEGGSLVASPVAERNAS